MGCSQKSIIKWLSRLNKVSIMKIGQEFLNIPYMTTALGIEKAATNGSFCLSVVRCMVCRLLGCGFMCGAQLDQGKPAV